LVQGAPAARHLATICLGLAVVGARAVLREPEGVLDVRRKPSAAADSSADHSDSAIDTVLSSERPADFDLLWADYRDTFGIVWAKRFQERLNDIGTQQKWPARLTDAGMEWEPPQDVDRQQVTER